jgi:hypothetical protein
MPGRRVMHISMRHHFSLLHPSTESEGAHIYIPQMCYGRDKSEIGWDVRIALTAYRSFSSRDYLNAQRLRYVSTRPAHDGHYCC